MDTTREFQVIVAGDGAAGPAVDASVPADRVCQLWERDYLSWLEALEETDTDPLGILLSYR